MVLRRYCRLIGLLLAVAFAWWGDPHAPVMVLASKKSSPPPPPPPTPPPPTPNAAEIQAEQARQRALLRSRKGRMATVLTGQGLAGSDTAVTRPTLLGGGQP